MNGIDENKRRQRATELALDESANSIYNILMKPKGFKLRSLKWFCPELCELADRLREYYWSH